MSGKNHIKCTVCDFEFVSPDQVDTDGCPACDSSTIVVEENLDAEKVEAVVQKVLKKYHDRTSSN